LQAPTTSVLNGDSTEGSAFQRPLFVGRDTIRGGYAAEINARYSRLFQITERKSAEFLVESTNLGNRYAGLETPSAVRLTNIGGAHHEC
jgi:hypothetical protein